MMIAIRKKVEWARETGKAGWSGGASWRRKEVRDEPCTYGVGGGNTNSLWWD